MSDLMDDRNIPDEMVFYVRVAKYQVAERNKPNGPRPSSNVFSDSVDEKGVSGASIIFPHILEGIGGNISDAIVDPEQYGLVSLTAKDVRECEQGVIYDPKPDNADHHFKCGPAHGLICGPKSKSRVRAIARKAIWIVIPPE